MRWFTPYEASKAQAEKVALASGLDVVIVHPTRIYGPGPWTSSNSVTKMIDAYRRGWFRVLPAGGTAVGSWVYVDDLVAGHKLAMARGVSRQRYLLAGTMAPMREVLDTVGRVTGRPRGLIPLGAGALEAIAHAEEARARLLGAEPMVTAGHVRRLLAPAGYSSARAEVELGWRYRTLEQGVKDTLDWLDRTTAR
jgi:nucleoside-diphosphate-sugar epimerase